MLLSFTATPGPRSELVQLLKTPKTEIYERPLLSSSGPSNGYVYVDIPPPLETDYPMGPDLPVPRGTDQHRRTVHINAEANRRSSIKHGFEELRALIPSLKDVPTSSHKISKAALLHKGGDYIRQMEGQISVMSAEASQLKANIEALEMDISALQGFLPAHRINGQEKTQINGKMREKKAAEDNEKLQLYFKGRVCRGTEINWKYWAFSRLMKPLFEHYSEAVSGSVSLTEVERNIHRWLEDKCSSTQLRQLAVTSLKAISSSTTILNEPRRMPVDALELARKQ